MNNLIKCPIPLLILIIAFFLSNCQIKIPIKYYPVYNYIFSSPPRIMRNIIQQNVYANIEIGVPKSIIQLPLKFDSNEFYIVNYDMIQKDSDKYSDIKVYNSSKSSSFDISDDIYYVGNDFELATYNKDIFYFNNEKYEMEFYYPLDYRNCDSGGIGMQFLSRNYKEDTSMYKGRTFFDLLKKNDLIQSYHWSIFYNSKENKKEEEGFILIGCFPHDINTELGYYKKGSFKKENLVSVNIVYLGLSMNIVFSIDSIYAYIGKDKTKIIDDYTSELKKYQRIKLDYNCGAVEVPSQLKIYYHKIFEEYISKGECFNDTIKINKNVTFYYCKKNQKTISKIKSVFPSVNFESNLLMYNFTLDADDLFIEENDYIFCLLYFPQNAFDKTWIMGKPFLKKYLFSINYDQKVISFYNNIINSEEEK